MLNRIIRFSLNNRLLILIAASLLMIGGFYTANKTEVDVFPDLNAPTVVVMTEAQGMASEEVELLEILLVSGFPRRDKALNAGQTGGNLLHLSAH